MYFDLNGSAIKSRPKKIPRVRIREVMNTLQMTEIKTNQLRCYGYKKRMVEERLLETDATTKTTREEKNMFDREMGG